MTKDEQLVKVENENEQLRYALQMVRKALYEDVGTVAEFSVSPVREFFAIRSLRLMIDALEQENKQLKGELDAIKAKSTSLESISPEEAFEIAVKAGIYTPDGELTEPYR